MSNSLRTLLHDRATSVAFKPPDTATIARAGGRRIRRRRAFATLATVAGVALAGSGVALVVGGGPAARPPVVPATPWPLDAVSWSIDDTIYVGATETIDVGHLVYSYVRTSVGFATVDDADNVYSVTELGVTNIGRLTPTEPDNRDQQRIVSDPAGSLVGWVAEDTPGLLALHVHDQATGETRTYPIPDARPPDDAVFYAIDDRTGYFRMTTGLYALDLETGSQRELLASEDLAIRDMIYDYEIYSVESGVLAFSPNSDQTILAGRSMAEAIELYEPGDAVAGLQVLGQESNGMSDPVRLSPDAAWLSFGVLELDQSSEEVDAPPVFSRMIPVVFDVATGQQVTLTIPNDPTFAFPGVWLDDTTLQVVSFTVDLEQPQIPTSLVFYECSLLGAMCQVVNAEPPPNDIAVIVPSPDGRWYGP
jgi:dipeptidyl aminopeptidase/acylaminoacyl peptidase